MIVCAHDGCGFAPEADSPAEAWEAVLKHEKEEHMG